MCTALSLTSSTLNMSLALGLATPAFMHRKIMNLFCKSAEPKNSFVCQISENVCPHPEFLHFLIIYMFVLY